MRDPTADNSITCTIRLTNAITDNSMRVYCFKIKTQQINYLFSGDDELRDKVLLNLNLKSKLVDECIKYSWSHITCNKTSAINDIVFFL